MPLKGTKYKWMKTQSFKETQTETELMPSNKIKTRSL